MFMKTVEFSWSHIIITLSDTLVLKPTCILNENYSLYVGLTVNDVTSGQNFIHLLRFSPSNNHYILPRLLHSQKLKIYVLY